jgi:hypothetical protein
LRAALTRDPLPPEVAAQVVETLGPELVVVSNPIGDLAEGRGLDAVDAAPARFSRSDQPRAAEDREVLGKRGLAHVERGEELGGILLAIAEAIEDGPPGGIGDGVEDGGVGGCAGHAVNISANAYMSRGQ